ncbi:MAG: chromosomal replication initiator protein DnaA [Gemmatimonadetes bacterium]|nr:chromosomal replication initiator protein DnaA [Gemmatimonadota bacterium]
MSQDPYELWAQCLLNIERRVRPQTFNTWFRPTRVRRFDGESLIVEVTSSWSADFIESKYLEMIRQVVREETGLGPQISFIVADEGPADDSSPNQPEPLSSSQPQDTSAATLSPTPPHETPSPDEGSSFSPLFQPLNERYTFETFVIGEGNRFAHAAAQAVSQSPGKTQFNPLVIYGGVGLGKTHLLQAIGHHALRWNRAQRVAFVPSEKFMSDFIEAIRKEKTAEFRRLYRSPEILLIDDIQFLLRGESTQNEFFHTFNALHQSGKQIVMTCDSPPGKMEGMEERLVSRFQWGLVTSIEPPDLETRIAILQQKAEINGIHLPEEVAVFLGNYISSNIRELEGGLIHLMAYCSVNRTELTVEAAKQIVQERGPAQNTYLSIETIQQHVAEYFNLTPNLLIGKTRKQEVAGARQIAMFLSKRLTKNPLKVIGLHFGNRDHSTVVHAIQTVEKKSKRDVSFAQMVETLSETVQQKHPLR